MCAERQSAAKRGDLLLRHLEGKLMRGPRERERDREIRKRNRLGERETEGQAHAAYPLRAVHAVA